MTKVQLGNFSSIETFYYSAATFGNGTTEPDTDEDTLLKSPSGDELAVYAGNVTEIGFAEGSKVQYIATQDLVEGSQWWHTGQEDYPGTEANLHRQQGIPSIPAKTGYAVVSIEFALSTAIAAGDVFHVWAYDADSTHIGGGAIPVGGSWAATGYAAAIFDTNGDIATSLEANTVYVLKLRMDGAVRYSVANIVFAGMTTYFSASSLAYENEEVGVLESKPTYSTDGGHSNETLPTYDGNVTDLGFAEGTEVFVQTIASGWDDRAIFNVDSTYDYVDIQFVGGGVCQIFIWTCGMDGNMTVGNYILNSDGTITLQAGGPNNDIDPPVREIYILGANGKILPTAWEAGKVYTLRIYIEELTKVQLGNFSSIETFYYSTATFGNGTTEPDPDVNPGNPISVNIFTQDKVAPLPVYKGDVTALGFAAGTDVVECTTTGDTWTDAAYFDTDETTNCLTVKFSLSSVFASGSQFRIYAWFGGDNHGWIASIIDCAASDNMVTLPKDVLLLNEDGTPVTEWEVGKVYTLKIYHGGAVAVAINVDETTANAGFCVYYDNAIVENNDEYVEPELPDPTPDPEPSTNMITQGDNRNALSTYEGDVTALGFAAGTTVYEAPMTQSWNDRVIVAFGATNYDYVDIDFVITSGTLWYFNTWLVTASGMLDGSYLVAESMGGTAHATYGNGYAVHHPNAGTSGGYTRIQVLDADGNVVTGGRTNGTKYTLRVYLKDEGLTEVQFGQDNITMCLADVRFGIIETVVAGGSNKDAVTVYDADETLLGFAAGSRVYKYVGVDSNDKISIKVDPTKYDYVDVQIVFDEASTKTWFLGFVMSGSSYLNGADAYILGGDQIRFNANASNPLDRVIQFLDADGNVVNTALQTGVVYTLRVYIKEGGVTEIQMRQSGVTAYLANVTQSVEQN